MMIWKIFFFLALVRHANLETTYGPTSEIIRFLKDGEKAIRVSPEKDVILVLGMTGSGKSSLTQFVTGNDEHLEGVEVDEYTGEYVIHDQGNKVCAASTESCTTVPDLIVDRKTRTPFYDCPGFGDTRHFKHDLSVTYFIKKVISFANAVKMIFTASYPSVRRGVDRQKFILLVKNAVNMIKDIDKFKGSIALVVTKVDNRSIRKGKSISVSDEAIIRSIASFLNEVKSNLMAKLSQGPLPESEYTFLGNAVKFIDVLLIQDGNSYPRIGIFRRPDDEGKLISPMMLKNRESLEVILHEKLNFTMCDADDFSYTVSAETINCVHEMVEQINQKIASEVETLAEEIVEWFLLQERDVSDVVNLYEKFKFGYEATVNLTKTGDPRDFLMKIRQTAGILGIELSRKSVDAISHYIRFLNFVRTFSGTTTVKPLVRAEGLTDVVTSLDDSQKWYGFLLDLRAELKKHDVQKDLSKNSAILDNLRDEIRVFGNDASPIKESLKKFLVKVYKDYSEKEYDTIKNLKLNSWKLKFFKNMLDFQVFTLCQDDKLVVIGNYVHLSDVAQKKCEGAKFMEIFALSKIFIDADFDKTGSKIQLSILAPTWDVIGRPRIIVDGEPGVDYRTKASDGAGSGADGHDGLPGSPGGAAGNFLGFGWNCINCQNLTIMANGGRGGKGQDGGDGVDGKNGSRPQRANHYKNIFSIGLVTVSHEDKGSTGQRGGDGGRGGAGGRGGYHGSISMFMFDTPEGDGPKTSELDGSSGIPGNPGKGGTGGVGEHLVESSTYIMGMKAWTNGIVSSFFFSSDNGHSKSKHNSEGMKYPEPAVDLVNPSYPVNHYKAYLRENLDSSSSRLSLEAFLEQLETSKDVRNLYDTLGLVNDLLCLENQYHKLHRRVPLLPFYKSLKNKIEAYAVDPPFSEITGQYRKVRAFLFLSTLSKICTIDDNLSNNLVINVKDFVAFVANDVDELLKDMKVAKKRYQQRNAYQKSVSVSIAEANSFIKEDITLEIQAILAEVDGEIRALVLETQQLQNITRKELKKLNEHMITRGISTVMEVASRALAFFSGAGIAVEGVIGSTNLIAETLAVEDGESPSTENLGILPKMVGEFFSSISDHIGEKVKLLISRLFDVEKIFEGAGIPALNETRSVVMGVRQELSEMSIGPVEDSETVDRKRMELIDFLRDQKKAMEMVSPGESVLEKALDVLDRSEDILNLPNGVYNVLRESNVVHSSGVRDAHEKLKHLEAYEEKIYSILIPLSKELREQFDDFSSFGGQSHAALDVGKWKVQNALGDINSQITSITDGFEVGGLLSGTLKKLQFGISTMIQVYDRIQDHYDLAALADYIAEMASEKAKAIEVTDRQLSDAIDDLQVILKTNLILANYEMALNAFGQHVFPFAKAYMEEYDLPVSLKAENTTDDVLFEAIHQITSMNRKLIKNDLTINKNIDDNFFPAVSFTSKSLYGPFYVWEYETSYREISQLLQGKEVVLHADITQGLAHNAVKFNEIGVRFQLGNQASQVIFDELMENFSIEMNHFGLSYYRCGTKFYVMTHDTQKIRHSVNEDVVGNFYHNNAVYEKITNNEPLLSPYTMWKVKLRSISGGFEALTNFTTEIIDLALEGRGTFVGRDIDRHVCSNHLDSFYKVDGTVHELPNIVYMSDPNSTTVIGPEEVVTRRRRGVGNVLNESDDDFVEDNGGSRVFSPLKNFLQWFTAERKVQDMNSPQSYYEADAAREPSSVYSKEPRFSGNLGSDNSHSLSLSPQVNYDSLKASEGNLLLLDLLMPMKTGPELSSGARSLDISDEKYAPDLAYPEN